MYVLYKQHVAKTHTHIHFVVVVKLCSCSVLFCLLFLIMTIDAYNNLLPQSFSVYLRLSSVASRDKAVHVIDAQL